MYTISERVFIGGLSVLFCMITIGFVALIYVVSIWAKNKYHERIAYADKRSTEYELRNEKERKEWSMLLGIKDKRIDELTDKLNIMTRKYQITKALLEKSERERLHGNL